MYSDEKGTMLILPEDTIIPAGHELIFVNTKEATCTENGNKEHWHCSACGKYFADGSGAHEISEAETVILATGHAYEYQYNEKNTGRFAKSVGPRPSG